MVLRRLLRADPYREECQRALMALLTEQGRGAEAVVLYRQLQQRLRAELDAHPDPKTRRWCSTSGDARPKPPPPCNSASRARFHFPPLNPSYADLTPTSRKTHAYLSPISRPSHADLTGQCYTARGFADSLCVDECMPRLAACMWTEFQGGHSREESTERSGAGLGPMCRAENVRPLARGRRER
jgi:hypothetical protein